MINIDLVNVDFDISKDREQTLKYMEDLNQNTPFSVLDNTYTEHLRAVLNYSPILTVRKPFMGCEVIPEPPPAPQIEGWVGTYIGLSGYPLGGSLFARSEQTLGSYTSSQQMEDGRNLSYSDYRMSVPSTLPTAKTYLSYTIDEYTAGMDRLVTDIKKDGVLLDKETLKQGIYATFLPPTLDTFKAVYGLPLSRYTSSWDTTGYYALPPANYYTNKLYLNKGMTVNGSFAETNPVIAGTVIESDSHGNYLKLSGDEPVLLDVYIRDMDYPQYNILHTGAYGDSVLYEEYFKLWLLKGDMR